MIEDEAIDDGADNDNGTDNDDNNEEEDNDDDGDDGDANVEDVFSSYSFLKSKTFLLLS